MKKLVLLFLGVSLLASCADKDAALYPVKGYVTPESGQVRLSTLFKQTRLIPLETNDSSLIGGRMGNKVVQRDSMFSNMSTSIRC